VRPLRLDLAGFAAFRDETTIDFTDTDFFALVGPTGAGKSTVLDAICFALYGTVPRWGDRKAISNALAPSATEARVRLVFESAGSRYVASRVVRRSGKGKVSTAHAGLELLPAGFDVTKFDTGLSPEDLGEVLAGTPGEMEQAVLEAVGLPYEQFTTCVLLPQGEFAEFLHAKPATRQQILVNLLGLDVYERIRVRAGERAARAEAHLSAVDRVLADLSDVDDEAIGSVERRVAAMRRLAAEVDAAVPRLLEAERDATAAAEALAALDREIGELDGVSPPPDAHSTASAAAQARAAASQTAEAVTVAEEREEKLRGEMAGAADPAALRLLLQQYEERDRLAGHSGELTAMVAQAQAEHGKALTALRRAEQKAAGAAAELEAAREAYQQAQTADRAAALRAHLAVGDDCPVCTQTVTALPPMPEGSAVAAAEAAGKAARAAADAADRQVAERDRAARELDRSLAAARAQEEQLAGRLAELDGRLAGAPGPDAVRGELAGIARLQRRLEQAATGVRAAREAHRRAVAGAEAAEERLRDAWREFDARRDALAVSGARHGAAGKLGGGATGKTGGKRGGAAGRGGKGDAGRLAGPPPADRGDLAAAWKVLADWARALAGALRAERDRQAAAAAAAEEATAAVRAEIEASFVEATVPPPADHTAYGKAAAVALERAEAAQRRLAERREQAERLREQRAGHERDSQLARSLAGHLRANNFERWLLAEALDLLVDGASRILRELSGGQYDLIHDKGEFSVVDHYDAGLSRPVRTLSGGETFQASLALALALSEQLAGMSTTSASLESIVLDEGFGTLDAATLETVAATLENLAARGDRMVGVVTHVPALAERIPVRFEVRKDARSAHVERVDS
jgi:DNA repair protein SbcC/Rad50